jgi:hypothetical protein
MCEEIESSYIENTELDFFLFLSECENVKYMNWYIYKIEWGVCKKLDLVYILCNKDDKSKLNL